jgi:hypothetical protein
MSKRPMEGSKAWNPKYDKYFEEHEERKANGEKLVEYVNQ